MDPSGTYSSALIERTTWSPTPKEEEAASALLGCITGFCDHSYSARLVGPAVEFPRLERIEHQTELECFVQVTNSCLSPFKELFLSSNAYSC